MWFDCNYRGGGISNSQIITEEGKYALDAVQNNPDVDNTLASKIKKLETTSPIATKDITVNNVGINGRSSDMLYFGYVNNFFMNNDIPIDKVISILIRTWNGASHMFSTFVYTPNNALGFISPTAQTITSVLVRVVYLNN